MVRKQIYITEEQERRLKEHAANTGLKESEIIRDGIDRALSEKCSREDRMKARAQAHALAAKIRAEAVERGESGTNSGGRTWTRDDLYD